MIVPLYALTPSVAVVVDGKCNVAASNPVNSALIVPSLYVDAARLTTLVSVACFNVVAVVDNGLVGSCGVALEIGLPFASFNCCEAKSIDQAPAAALPCPSIKLPRLALTWNPFADLRESITDSNPESLPSFAAPLVSPPTSFA